MPIESSSGQPWLRARPPFKELRQGVKAAEARLNGELSGGDHAWRRLREAVGDEARSAEVLNGMLVRARCGWRLVQRDDSWLVRISGVSRTSSEIIAVLALARFIEADGWRRLKRCSKLGCTSVFLDITNGCSSVVCRAHRRQQGARSTPARRQAGGD